jgi:hypothetical protein
MRWPARTDLFYSHTHFDHICIAPFLPRHDAQDPDL